MSTFQHILARKTLAGVLFAMAFLLTPRVMVEGSTAQPSGYIAMEQLDSTMNDECLWCTPRLEAVNCDEQSSSSDTPWLNPDAPVPTRNAPCIQGDKSDTEGM